MRDHWLDGECVSRLHDADGLVLGVVGDVGRAVEEAVDAVTAVRPNHGEALGLRVLLDHVANVAVLGGERDSCFQCFDIAVVIRLGRQVENVIIVTL